VVKLVSICDRIADLSELLEHTAELLEEDAKAIAPSRRGRRASADRPTPSPSE
jgi:hypothetical protein